MTTLLNRPLTSKRDTKAAVALPSVMQVNLLPQQYSDRYKLGALKRRLGFALVAVLAFAVVGYGVALTNLNAAQDRQAKAEAESTRLLQAQQQYSEVPVVLSALARAEDARLLGMSTEILWAPYLGAIGTVMPEGVTLTNITMDGATPMLAPAPPSNPLQAESVATVRFEARSTQMIDTPTWIDALNGVPGFHDAWVSTASATDREGTTVYTFSSTVKVSALAYALRFVEKED